MRHEIPLTIPYERLVWTPRVSLSGLSKSNRWVKLADRLPWAKIEKEYNKRLRNSHCGQATSPPAWLLGGLSSSLNRNEVSKGTYLSRFRKKQAWRPSKREFSVPPNNEGCGIPCCKYCRWWRKLSSIEISNSNLEWLKGLGSKVRHNYVLK